jgi:aspartokinase-like uncharacterized kinase
MIVLKVGGSLFPRPNLAAELRQIIAEQSEAVMLVPGGGELAEAIRAFDRQHHLGESASHFLALQTLSITARFLQHLLPEANLVPNLETTAKLSILDCDEYFRDDPSIPQSWGITSDSLALIVAQRSTARKLILCKSLERPANTDWEELSNLNMIDSEFPRLYRDCPIRCEWMNFPSFPQINRVT